MPVSPQMDQITPFADSAMRLLREKWANPNMLAEEIFPIFQTGIPTVMGRTTIQVNYGSTEDGAALTLENFGTGDFVDFNDQYGNSVFRIDQFGSVYAAGQIQTVGTKPRPGEPSKKFPLKRPKDPVFTRRRPLILWDTPADITEGAALSGTQLNARATDDDSGRELAGTFAYDPPSGTVLAEGDGQPLFVLFTPKDLNLYLRVSKTVFINVNGSGGIVTHPVLTGATDFLDYSPVAESSYLDQGLTAEGQDPSNVMVAGTVTFTPNENTSPVAGTTSIHVVFAPTDTVTYDGSSADLGITVNLSPLLGSAVVTSSDGSSVIVDEIDLGLGVTVPAGESATVDPITGDSTINPGDSGMTVVMRYDRDDEAWYYTYSYP